ncbi:MAG: transporter substrate-binding domain-containing protein [Fusobacteriaceae bacterium]|jgi:cyclohexadienyl dehydratase|nr:transporter substrate-binding domain-containing protein [Fusobacteriaceae bacterium]
MKKSLRNVLIAVLVVLTAACAYAGDRLDAILSKKVLRVGTPGDYRPFSMLTDGKYEGYDIDVIELIAKELGVTVEYVPTVWKNLLTDLKEDKYDLALGGITRNPTRVSQYEFLPGYAPFGKVALIRKTDKDKYTTLESMNKPEVRVIKNPGGTNEAFVLANLTGATVSTHEKNAEIPGLIAEGKGDVMITETFEALLYAQKDDRLYAAFIDKPLTPINKLGFMIQKDDPDYVRVLNFLWDLLETRGELQKAADKWLK